MGSNCRESFAEALYAVSVSDTNTLKENEEHIDVLSNKVIDMIPEKVYKFRTCKDYAIEAFRKDEIWGSLPREMNDPMECTPCYNLDKLTAYFHHELCEENILKIFNTIKNGDIPTELCQNFSDEAILLMKKQVLNNTDETKLTNMCRNLKSEIFTYINQILNTQIDAFFTQVFQFQHQLYLTCFSENLHSYLMWGHYASSHKGFAIEYEMKGQITSCSKKCDTEKFCDFFHLNHQFAPVVYGLNRYDSTAFFSKIISLHIVSEINKRKMVPFYVPPSILVDTDRFRVPKTILTKSQEWAYEREWRMFSYKDAPSPERHIVLAKNIIPSAAYLGVHISEEDTNTLVQICKEKHIDCFKMAPSYTQSAFELTTMKIYDATTDEIF